MTANEVRSILSRSPGVKLVDDPANKMYPMPLTATGQWDVEVGRIRENDVFGEYPRAPARGCLSALTCTHAHVHT